MFEAYKVGVTLSLQNQVSGILGFIARDFIKADREAKKLQATLREIKLLGMGGALLGGAGFLGLGAIRATIEPAKEYVHQLELAKTAGMSQLEIARATKAAWAATGQVMTTTATDNIASIKELRMVFGNTDDAIRNMPTVQRLQAVLGNIHGDNATSKDSAYTIAKALEQKGDVKDIQRFNKAANLMTKSLNASGGKVTENDFLSTFKYGRAATLGWNDDFTYGVLPTLIQEMKTRGGTGGAGGPGNALASAYAEVVGGSIPQRSLKEWEKLGLLDPSKIVKDKVGSTKGVAPGGIRGSQDFIQNPYEWVKNYLAPALDRSGYKSDEAKKQALQYLFPNRTSDFIISQMAFQAWKFDRDRSLIEKAQGLSSYDELRKNDPIMAEQAASAQWKNLKTVIGIEVIPVLIPFLHKFSEELQSLSSFARENPTLTKGVVATVAALSGLAAIGGTLMIAAAGVKLIGATFSALGAANLTVIGSGLAGIATGVLALAAPVATLYGILHHQSISDRIDRSAPGIGDRLLKIRDWFSGWSSGSDSAMNGNFWSPQPGNGKTVQVNTQVNLDGRRVANVVSQHQANSANTPSTSGSGFDSRQSFVDSSYNPFAP